LDEEYLILADDRKITLANFENSIAGVVEGKLIPIMRL
jgi:hypothetical protein